MRNEAYNSARILIVDDEEANVLLLTRMLTRAGYTHLSSTQDSREVEGLVKKMAPDLVLLDLMMPFMDGYAVIEKLVAQLGPEDYLPIMVLTADVTPQALQRALSSGAKDFLTKPFDQTELLLRVHNLLETRFLYSGMRAQLSGLEGLNAQAQQAVLLRNQSLSTISHDMGQPLAAVRLTVETLQDLVRDADLPEKKELTEDLQRIVQAATQMSGMISEMSDLARLQMGRQLVLQKRPCDLVALVKEQLSVMRQLAGKHHLKLDTKLATLVGEWDEVRIARVVSNLLNNAIKFSPKGGNVDVVIESDGERASLAVSDQGVGIPETEVSHVFDPFYRASNVVTRIPGTGVGLASAKQILEQHGGTIAVESVSEQGTTVRISLPFRWAPEQQSVSRARS